MKTETEIIPTYEERSASLQVEASLKWLDKGVQHYEQGIEHAKRGAQELLLGVCEMRDAGLAFIRARGHEQLTFDQYGLEWYRGVQTLLPKTLTVQNMELVVRVARSLPNKPRNLEECKPAIQLLLLAAEEIPPTRRIEQQSAHERNLFNSFVSTMMNLPTMFSKLEQEEPLSQWNESKLEQFVRNGKPIVEKVREAETLLASQRN